MRAAKVKRSVKRRSNVERRRLITGGALCPPVQRSSLDYMRSIFPLGGFPSSILLYSMAGCADSDDCGQAIRLNAATRSDRRRHLFG